MSPRLYSRHSKRSGFSLTELTIGAALSVIVLGAALAAVWTCLVQWYSSDLYMRVCEENSRILERMVYGSQGAGGLREADGATLVSGTNGWTLTYRDAAEATQTYAYSPSARTIVYLPGPLLVCSNVAFADVATNAAGDGLSLRVGLQRTEGRFAWSNAMGTFVQFRNRWTD